MLSEEEGAGDPRLVALGGGARWGGVLCSTRMREREILIGFHLVGDLDGGEGAR